MIQPARRSAPCGTIPNATRYLPAKMENSMRVDLRRRDSARDHFLLTYRATVPTLIVLLTAVTCSRPAAYMPQPRLGVVEHGLSFSGLVTDKENWQFVQRSDRQPIPRRVQHQTFASPKVAKVHTPDTSSAPDSRHVLEKANTPRLLESEKDQLFRQFLEWRKRQTDVP